MRSPYYYMRFLWVKSMRLGTRIGCHQLPERSFYFRNYQFPVCARCCGVLLGQITAIVLFLFTYIINIKISITLAAIMLLDWGIQYIGVLESNNIRRVITGFLGGLGCWSALFYVIKIIIQTIFN